MRKLLAGLTALALAGTATAACGSSGASENSQMTVTLRVGDQKAGSQALLQAAGQLSGLTYKITWAQFTSGPPMLEAVNAGAVDIGRVGNTPPIFAAAANSKITVVAGDNQRLDGQALLVPKNSTVKTLAELGGKRIAVAKGSSAHYHLLAALTKAGLGVKDVSVSYLQPADALAALTSGRIDAWAIWDPYTAQAQEQTGARILVDGNGLVNGYGFEVASHGALADKAKVAAIRDYLTRLDRAQLWANTHQTEWARVWAQQTGLSYDAALVAARRRVATPITINDTVIASEQRVADAFTAAKLIPGRVKFADFTDRQFNSTVPGGSS